MTTTGVRNLPRDKQGKWRRQVANAERDARAAELAARGLSYDAIARELNYGDRAQAWRGAQKALREIAASHGLDEIYRTQVEEIRQVRAAMWEIVRHAPPATDRLGRIVRDDHGGTVPDVQAQVNAATVIIKAQERLARLTGVDAPRKSVTMSVDQASEVLRQHLKASGFPDPGSPESRAWFMGRAPLELADGRVYPPLSAGQLAELDADLGRAVIEARREDQ